MRRPLTARQLEALEAIRNHQVESGLSPTLEELGRALGVGRITAYGHVQALLQKGYLENLEPGASRGLELTDLAHAFLRPADTPPRAEGNSTGGARGNRRHGPVVPSWPVLGRIAAGRPLDVVQEEAPTGLADLLPASGDLYLLQVEGTSMIEDHIQDGDWVIVRRDRQPMEGEIVVAVLEDETATLKRLRRRPDGGYRLQPAHPTAAPLDVERLEIRGVVVGVLRRY